MQNARLAIKHGIDYSKNNNYNSVDRQQPTPDLSPERRSHAERFPPEYYLLVSISRHDVNDALCPFRERYSIIGSQKYNYYETTTKSSAPIFNS